MIILDSSPLGLILQKTGYQKAEASRAWLAKHVAEGSRIVVPEIIDYEVRRELLRLKDNVSVQSLDRFNSAEVDRFLRLNAGVLLLAADCGQPLARKEDRRQMCMLWILTSFSPPKC